MVKSLKYILSTPEEREAEPPSNFPQELSHNFRRLSELNPAVVDLGDGKIEIFPRVIYSNSSGNYSMITRRRGFLEDGLVRLEPKEREEAVFVPGKPYARRGYEDLRLSTVETEEVYHAFPVVYDGTVARTEYRRTSGDDPKNLSHFEEFGIIFPNIEVEDALSRVKDKYYRAYWQEELRHKTSVNRGRDSTSEGVLLGTKDACSYPLKINGKYIVIYRLKPNIQIIEIDEWSDLNRREIWQEATSNIREHTLLEATDQKNGWIGLGGSPFEIPGQGMVIPFHTGTMKPKRVYTGEYALVEPRNPQKVLGRTNGALEVTELWERAGEKQDVPGDIVFQTGNIVYDNNIYTFYGYGDYGIAYTSMKSEDLLKRLN